jgi:hypothetical protein
MNMGAPQNAGSKNSESSLRFGDQRSQGFKASGICGLAFSALAQIQIKELGTTRTFEEKKKHENHLSFSPMPWSSSQSSFFLQVMRANALPKMFSIFLVPLTSVRTAVYGHRRNYNHSHDNSSQREHNFVSSRKSHHFERQNLPHSQLLFGGGDLSLVKGVHDDHGSPARWLYTPVVPYPPGQAQYTYWAVRLQQVNKLLVSKH